MQSTVAAAAAAATTTRATVSDESIFWPRLSQQNKSSPGEWWWEKVYEIHLSLPFLFPFQQTGEEVGKWGESYLLCTTQPAEAEDEIYHLSQKLDKKPRKKSSVYFSLELIFLVRENVTLFFPLFLGLADSVSKFLALPLVKKVISWTINKTWSMYCTSKRRGEIPNSHDQEEAPSQKRETSNNH